MKPGKVFSCMFLFANLGVDPAAKPGKTKKVITCAHTTNQ